MAQSLSIVKVLAEHENWKSQGEWVPANGGTETPTLYRTGRRLLYCYQPRSAKHAWLDCDTDLILSDEDAILAMGKD